MAVSFALVVAIAALLVVSTHAQSLAPSPYEQTPRTISPTPAQSPMITATPALTVTAITLTAASTTSTNVTSSPSSSPVVTDVLASSPSSISRSSSSSPTGSGSICWKCSIAIQTYLCDHVFQAYKTTLHVPRDRQT
ncbi:classical arabinogalactan protein 1-like [Humulus lupulus]|uniref:classical arabinogalactan protein 1-like n=1 Tax=Humulus lupulus TaxID=3486 RepID=UPI002B40ECAD|nr:classical arabinogalactan protein 1-like [Humulus lupulus]